MFRSAPKKVSDPEKKFRSEIRIPDPRPCLEYSATDVDLLVDDGILEELEPEVCPPQGDVTLRAGTAT